MTAETFNKWVGAILSAMLVLFAVSVIVQEAFDRGAPQKPGFVVAEDKGTTSATTETAAAQPDPPIADALKKADVDTGNKLTRPCQACHDFTKGGPNKVGPELWGVVGRKVASIDGFAYSEPMKAKSGTWGYDELYKFLADPKKVVPGTKMGFAGYPNSEDRANVIAYLRTLADTPQPMP
jgi:cytochrome c